MKRHEFKQVVTIKWAKVPISMWHRDLNTLLLIRVSQSGG
jgi:hypothetical protein